MSPALPGDSDRSPAASGAESRPRLRPWRRRHHDPRPPESPDTEEMAATDLPSRAGRHGGSQAAAPSADLSDELGDDPADGLSDGLSDTEVRGLIFGLGELDEPRRPAPDPLSAPAPWGPWGPSCLDVGADPDPDQVEAVAAGPPATHDAARDAALQAFRAREQAEHAATEHIEARRHAEAAATEAIEARTTAERATREQATLARVEA
ncbi:MAG: hypothetical protein H7233_01530, partial [Pseudorhodobacter sp.]|nr:hypothetical protein [Frankiaceae bacterium]